MRFNNFHQTLHRHLAFAGLVLIVALNAPAGFGFQLVQEPAKKTQPNVVSQPSQDDDAMVQLRKSVRKLAVEVERLTTRVTNLEKERLFDVTRVLLVGEEQRGEALQARLRETQERQFALQARLEQVDNQLKPENIERMFIGIGMVRPEEARDNVRRRLGLEKGDPGPNGNTASGAESFSVGAGDQRYGDSAPTTQVERSGSPLTKVVVTQVARQ